ncbi:LapA family protein [Paenibacillus camelliae]|uniref:LapA family protein n=1 Tax=Paenibacillus camelliae TaxID=512410 RepID=UPI00203D4B84|nr:lipopolysaccharide assembly protein LapA domain-containing protein [Paenibacillus camelliae]MCM3633794.1 lipopolysaccharide assembly protein LapA domain-containing protein [Paenibacillus camelliae]
MKSQWTLIVGLLFALIIAIFAVINVEAVEVNYLFGSTSTPLILVIMISTLFGGLAVGSLGMFRVFVLQRKVKQLEKQLEKQQTDEVEVIESPMVVSEDEKLEIHTDEQQNEK